jgi:nucleoside-diphosphate-sugar epimerase
VPFDEFRAQTTPEHADASLEHISRSHSVSNEKARRLLGYSPRYTSLQAVAESLEWLSRDGQLDVGGETLSA